MRRDEHIDLDVHDIKALCFNVRPLLLREPSLLELKAPLKVVGDVHGQYYDLLRLLDEGGEPSKTTYLFLGDYVDRGTHSVETICLLLAYKMRYPDSFFMLRGNHEDGPLNETYGFYEECKNRYSVRLFNVFADIFMCLPVAATIDDKIFCVHGGLSPALKTLGQIKKIKRPTAVPVNGLLCDLLWSDPERGNNGWKPNELRRTSFTFGENEVRNFLDANKLDLICRAHQVVKGGYEYSFHSRLVTIFSAPDYERHKNAAAIMSVDRKLQVAFRILKPE